jgi:hypothetical protein
METGEEFDPDQSAHQVMQPSRPAESSRITMIEETKPPTARITSAIQVPAIRTDDPWLSSAREYHPLFTEEERAQLSPIVSVLRFKKGAQIYPQGTRACLQLSSMIADAR